MMEIDIPESLDILQIAPEDLPAGWNSFPHLKATREKGDAFIHNKAYPVCKVPSAVVPGECNILINPNHPEFQKIKISEVVPFPIDRRLFRSNGTQ